jgi:hypothetical protein
MSVVRSKNGVPIRLTDERWEHIVNEHGELTEMQKQILDAIIYLQRILDSNAGDLLAVLEVEIGKWLVVVYRENGEDGFVITAFFTRRVRSLEKRRVIWPQ